MARYFIEVSDRAKKDISFHGKSGNKAIIKKLEKIFLDLVEHPYTGVGNPEQLKNNLTGLWSRRLDGKNRLVYSVDDECITIFIVTSKGHYNNK